MKKSVFLTLLLVFAALLQPFSALALLPNPIFDTGEELGSTFATESDGANDNFAVFSNNGIVFAQSSYPKENIAAPNVAGADASLIYRFADTQLPLYKQDYYWGKFQNGSAGARELNRIPVLKPGDRISVIANGYLTLSPSSGYVRPTNGYYYGSGLCWSTSALGQMMDNANAIFQRRYGIPLFVFGKGDRAPHPHWYKTYEHSNRGYGYTVIKIKSGGGQDYRFTVNPAIKNLRGMSDFKLQIVMTTTEQHPQAYKGQSIGGYILSNKDMRLVAYTDAKEIVKGYEQDFYEHFRTLR